MTMEKNPATRPALALVGPTGSGKSDLAQQLAEQHQGWIINLDAMQLYQDLLVGTARPTPESFGPVPHSLFGCLPPDQRYSAGEYCREAEEIMVQARNKGYWPILVGGTGLYLRALRFGLDAPAATDGVLREKLWKQQKESGNEYLLAVLGKLDPKAAAKIDAANPQRLVRAIELCLTSGDAGPTGPVRKVAPRKDLKVVVLTDRRQDLYERLNRRTDFMWQNGLVEETKTLIETYGPAASALRAIGYRQCAAFLEGDMSKDQAKEKMAQATRRYAKRQWTWFKREAGATWITRQEINSTGWKQAWFAQFMGF